LLPPIIFMRRNTLRYRRQCDGQIRLADHDRRRVGIAGNDRRHDRGIGYAQPRKTAHAQPFVDHGLWVLAHAALPAPPRSM
jgi:hypothetical protein